MIKTTLDWKSLNFDSIIDVRSPLEYEDDHIIGAINCPVLDDEQRAKIGFLYTKVSGFQAKIDGAAMTSRNIANHIENTFLNFGGDWQPLIYCWRGGQRSRAMGLILNEVGWRVTLLDGGYKKYRHEVMRLIPILSQQIKLVVISGQTGSGKTNILREISSIGGNILDLEALAGHRGSLLGAVPNHRQPSQKYFESKLLDVLGKYKVGSIVFVESESSKIGNLHIPNGLWSVMCSAPCIQIRVPSKVRAEFLESNYSDLKDDPARLKALFQLAKKRVPSGTIEEWKGFLERESWIPLALSLITNYYDPAYNSHHGRQERENIKTYSSSALTDLNIKELANNIIKTGEEFIHSLK